MFFRKRRSQPYHASNIYCSTVLNSGYHSNSADSLSFTSLWILLSSASLFIHELAATTALIFVSLFHLNPLQNSQHGFISLCITAVLFWLAMSLLQWSLWRGQADALFRSVMTAIAQTAASYYSPIALGAGVDNISPDFLWLSPIIAIAVGCVVGFAIDKASTVLTE